MPTDFGANPASLHRARPAHELAVEQVDVPAIVAAPAHLAVVESVHLFQMDAAVFHKAHHHAARGGSDVHRRIAVAPQITAHECAMSPFLSSHASRGPRFGRTPLTMSVFLNFYLGKRTSH